MIDRIELKLTHTVPLNQLRERCQKAGIKLIQERIEQSPKVHFRVGAEPGWYVDCGFYKSQQCWRVIVMPSRDYRFEDTYFKLRLLFTRNDIESAKIIRLDLAVDFDQPYEEALKGLDIQYARSVTSFHASGADRTGVILGKKPKVTALYDRTKKLETKRKERAYYGPKRTLPSRLEIKLYGPKIPIESITQLTRLIQPDEIGEPLYTPFEYISLNQVFIHNPRSFDKAGDIIKCTRLETLVNEIGFGATRRRLKEKGNFRRNYGKYIDVELLQDPDSLLQASLKEYFKSWKEDLFAASPDLYFSKRGKQKLQSLRGEVC